MENPMDRGAGWAIAHDVPKVVHDLVTEHVLRIFIAANLH